MKGHQEKEDLLKKEDKLCVITLDTYLKIGINLMIIRILEAKMLYVTYATTLDIQKNIIEWTGTSDLEGIMEET